MTETITWIDANERKPDIGQFVLVCFQHNAVEKSVDQGYWDTLGWRADNGRAFTNAPAWWAELPKGPGAS